MVQLQDIQDIVGLNNIRGLDVVASESERPSKYDFWFIVEENLRGDGLAPTLSAYLLYQHQFNGKSRLALAKELDVSVSKLTSLMKDMKIPIRTIREIMTGRYVSDETREKMSKSHKDRHYEEYNEDEIEIIRRNLEGIDLSKRVPDGTYQKIHDEILDEIGRYRQIHSIQVWINDNIKYPDKERKTKRRTSTRKQLEEILDPILDNLPGDLETNCLIGKPDSRRSRKERRKWVKEVPIGHQKLLIYMADPENYQRILDEDGVRLVRADFRRKDCKSEDNRRLYERLHKRVRSLEHCTNEDKEMINFADGWMRCDLIYRRTNGEYIVLEIKQNAVNVTVKKKVKGKMKTLHHRNADRTYEQIIGYVGGLGARIERYNTRHKRNPGFKRIPMHVDGFIAAYKIQEDLKEDLSHRRIGYVEIPKEEVDKYIQRLLDEKNKLVHKKRTRIKEGSGVTVLESNECTALVPYVERCTALVPLSCYEPGFGLVKEKNDSVDEENVDTNVTKTRLVSPLDVSFTETISITGDNGDHRDHPDSGHSPKEHFRSLHQSLCSLPKNSQAGVYDPQRNLVYFGGILYHLNGSNERVRKIRKLVEEGRLRQDRINPKHYSGFLELRL